MHTVAGLATRGARVDLDRTSDTTASSSAYDYRGKKIVAVLNAALSPGEALNVLGHLTISLGAHGDSLMGEPKLVDASCVPHTGIAKYPLIVTKVKDRRLRQLVKQARSTPALFLADFPQQMLTTGSDDELRAALADVAEEDILYLGAVVYGDSAVVSALTGRFTLWR